jgi:hypothetical protein
VPKEVREKMAFTFVATMDEVLRLALLPDPVKRADQLDEPGALQPETATRPDIDREVVATVSSDGMVG